MQLTYFLSKNYYMQAVIFIVFNSLKSTTLFYKTKFYLAIKCACLKTVAAFDRNKLAGIITA